jgi:nucleotide-binding universal stress UspA family protein
MYRRILVPVDGSDTSRHALQMALQLAGLRGSQVRVVHVVEDEAGPEAFRPWQHGGEAATFTAHRKVLEHAMQVARTAGIDAQTHLLVADGRRFGEVVADEARAWSADLMVVGSHGRRGMARALLGSGAEQALRLAPVPVLVVRTSAALPQSR